MQNHSSRGDLNFYRNVANLFSLLAVILMVSATIGCGGSSKKKVKTPIKDLKKITDPYTRADRAIKTANKLFKQGDTVRAEDARKISKKAIEKIEDDASGQTTLSIKLAYACLKHGEKRDANTALSSARGYSSKIPIEEKGEILANLSKAYQKAGDDATAKSVLKSALKAAEKNKDPIVAIDGLIKIAEASHALKDSENKKTAYEKALKLSLEIEKPDAKIKKLCQIANSQIRAEEKSAAIENLETAYAYVKEIPVTKEDFNPLSRAGRLLDIAEVHLKAKNKESVEAILIEAEKNIQIIKQIKLQEEQQKRYRILNAKLK